MEMHQERPSAHWISQGFEALAHRIANAESRACFDYDVLIVGSGYGGSIAAAELSQCTEKQNGLRIAVLERGLEYLPGMFPSHESELPGHIRFSRSNEAQSRGKRDGLFDLRLGPDVTAVLANGLGGGSLINAGVMLQPDDFVFRSWPGELKRPETLAPHFTAVKRKLGSLVAGPVDTDLPNTIADHETVLGPGSYPPKYEAMRQLGGTNAHAAPVSVAMRAGPNWSGTQLDCCTLCGNCMTGCNFSSKNSLDENLLAYAYRHGVDLYSGATVLDIAPLPETGWVARVVHTDSQLRRQEVAATEVRARRIILAAGAFGSTEILLRSRQRNQLALSRTLGARFSGNGDLMAAAYDVNVKVGSMAEHGGKASNQRVGPTITSVIDLRTGDEKGMVIEEFAIPAPMLRLFKEASALAHCFQQLSEYDESTHVFGSGEDPLALDSAALDRTLLLGVMGHDGSAGCIKIPDRLSDDIDGVAYVSWPDVRVDRQTPVFSQQVEVLESLLRKSKLGGKLLQNPSWKLMPISLNGVFEMPNGPALTVHPLGGCCMGENSTSAVVDAIGRVFDARTGSDTYEGLVVLDGSIIPTALGVNPALTIAAVANRAVEQLKLLWGLAPREAASSRLLPARRPVLRVPESERETQATEVGIIERLNGHAQFPCPDGTRMECVVELTLHFRPAPIVQLSGPFEHRQLHVDPTQSKLRIFERDQWQRLVELDEPEYQREASALFIAPISGSMRPFMRADSNERTRTRVATAAWRRNRGRRDAWQGKSIRKLLSIWRLTLARRALASRAGELRLFDYKLSLETPARSATKIVVNAHTLVGRKRFTYEHRSNPWKQLMQLELEGLSVRPPLRLELDLRYLAAQGIPLLHITQQRDQATALFDVLSFILYVVRLLICIHIWSFRKPDAEINRPCERLPQCIPGLKAPSITWLSVDCFGVTPMPVLIRLARYGGSNSGSPVLLIHGYSANGMTFAHPKLAPNLVSELCAAGHDVWVLDLRTSSGMEKTRDLAWSFEQIATSDIPRALGEIWRTREREARSCPIDVVAHCMGAAMVSMTILHRDPPIEIAGRPLTRILGSVVLSQVGPFVTLTPANVFRGFAMSYLKYLFRFDRVDFSPPESLMDDVLDRALSTLPYPDEEFDIENPRAVFRKTPFTRLRHRIDAWFGRIFRLTEMERSTLRSLPDMFGPVNLTTLFQTIHFARRKLITDRSGYNFNVTPTDLHQRWTMPTLTLHGTENGLVDVATARRLREAMADAFDREPGRIFHACRLPGFGHQDCLIGRRRRVVFAEIVRFLAAPAAYVPDPDHIEPWSASGDLPVTPATSSALLVPGTFSVVSPPARLLTMPPWIGPIVRRDPQSNEPLGVYVEADPQLGLPLFAVFVTGAMGSKRFVAGPSRPKCLPWPNNADRHRQTFAVPAECKGEAEFLTLLVYNQSSVARGGFFSKGAQEEAAVREVEQYLLTKPADTFRSAHVQMESSDRLLVREPSSDSLCFALGSCQYPPGMLDRRLAWRSYEQLAAQLDTADAAERPAFLVLTGDQVYVDASAGMFDPTTQDDRYGVPYERLLQAEPVRRVLRRVNAYPMLDDHEIDDNWAPLPERSLRHAAFFEQGKAAYRCFRAMFGLDDDPTKLWFTRSLGGAEFFFVDTRTERSLRDARSAPMAQMMLPDQFESLLEWVDEHARSERPMFIVSPSIVLPRRLTSCDADAYDGAAINPAATILSDAWDGYPATLHRLLAEIARVQPPKLVFLSGDEHRGCVADIELRHEGVTRAKFISIHSSALYAPYPFANGHEWGLAKNEIFPFVCPRTEERFSCSVDTIFPPPGDGFVRLRVDGGSRLIISFMGANAPGGEIVREL